jgi:hypothetical protein
MERTADLYSRDDRDRMLTGASEGILVAEPQAWNLFVGRDRELRDLVAMLDELWAGHGGLVLLGGEPGIDTRAPIDWRT